MPVAKSSSSSIQSPPVNSKTLSRKDSKQSLLSSSEISSIKQSKPATSNRSNSTNLNIEPSAQSSSKTLDSKLMFSKTEISIIKEIWKSLNLCENFNTINSKLDSNIIISKFKYQTNDNIIFKSYLNYQISEYYYKISKNNKILNFENDITFKFQIDIIIEILNVIIYHLSYKQNNQPQDFIISKSKLLNRLYDLNFKKFQILGECFISTILYLINKKHQEIRSEGNDSIGEEQRRENYEETIFMKQFVFLKFINQVFNILIYYGKDKKMKLLSDSSLNSITKDLPSLPKSPRRNNNDIILKNNSYSRKTPPTSTTTTVSSSSSNTKTPSSPSSSSSIRKLNIDTTSSPSKASSSLTESFPSPNILASEQNNSSTTSTTKSTAATITRDSTSSITSLQSNLTEGSSILSLNHFDDCSDLSNDMESITINLKSPFRSNQIQHQEDNIDNCSIDELEESTINTISKNSISTLIYEKEESDPLDDEKISNEYQHEEEEDSSYDYLNSFGLSTIDNNESIYYNSSSTSASKSSKKLKHKSSKFWNKNKKKDKSTENNNKNDLTSIISNGTFNSSNSKTLNKKKSSINLSLSKLNSNISIYSNNSNNSNNGRKSINNHQYQHEEQINEEKEENETSTNNDKRSNNSRNNTTITNSNDESCIIM
ncbi:uncharacterized protein KGF55_001892 [Candida pseudojiufengensis]|uniref:uncharacterized protein n=1 Tax=Candida pseudojiufengensis TaxID=497109 RepID=UPI0022241071|nr:uncharacterized protein KGF55_001892 [Candida pseudojiufengensis]KAI5964822.1 hypothetical protein KGF55_001892 [Candida pseudojiufengensis]